MGKYGCNPPIFGKHTMEDSVAAKRLFLLSGHKAFREAMACVLEQESDLEVVSQAGSLADMADANLDHNIDVALVDLSLSDGDAMAALRELSTQHGDVAVLGLNSSGLSSSIVRALGAGAAGVLAAPASLEEVVDAIRSSARG
jgi:two-component system, NarL family, response regulator DesR